MANDPVLIDTSGWIAFFRGLQPSADAIEELLRDERTVLCGPVELELRRGLGEHERQRVLPILRALPRIETGEPDFQAAGDLLHDLRTRGVTIPSIDGLIATLALRESIALLTLDRHFQRIDGLRLLPAP